MEVDRKVATEEELTDADIVKFKMVTSSELETEEEEEDVEEEPKPPVTSASARQMCRELVRYLEENGSAEEQTLKDIQQIWGIFKRVHHLQIKQMQQKSILDFFKPV